MLIEALVQLGGGLEMLTTKCELEIRSLCSDKAFDATERWAPGASAKLNVVLAQRSTNFTAFPRYRVENEQLAPQSPIYPPFLFTS